MKHILSADPDKHSDLDALSADTPRAATSEAGAGTDLDLGALIGSRICHDLTNPLGAIGNGLELLELTGQTDSPEMALIAQSVAQAKARVQFLRVAFGAAGAGHRMGGAELSAIVAEHTTGGRTAVRWLCDCDVPRVEAKFAFLLLMCVESALPFGGQIEVRRTEDGWHIAAEATRMRDLGAMWDGLTGRAPMPRVGPPQVQFALAAATADALGRPIAVTLGEGGLTLRA